MRTRSIRFRLTAWYALVLTAALCLFSGLLWYSLRQRLLHESDEELKGSAARFEAYFRKEAAEESGPQLRGELEEFCQALPATNYLALRGGNDFVFRYPDRDVSGLRNMRKVASEFHVGSDSYSLEVGASERGIHRTMELLQLLLFSLIPAAVAMACLGGAWLSRRALRPVDEVTVAARTIGIENLSQRLPVPSTGDELERLTEVWNGMLGRLESAVVTLSQFAADASHELRTPLAVIRTSAELALRKARAPESYRESLREIAAEAERMTQLVEDLLFLARGDTRSAGMAMSALDLREVVLDVSTELRDLAELRGIRIHCGPAVGALLVSGNRPALRRLFLVLLDNAIKYSHPGGEVRIEMSGNGDSAVVTVRDLGIGIAAADLPHIFQRFYRADKARSDGGHGLGLSLAASIARTHGAAMNVESVEGEWTAFTAAFPLRSGRLATEVVEADFTMRAADGAGSLSGRARPPRE